ncbi:cytochrome c oxidase subunit 4 isoform 2, mitochondrial isoform X2 [Halichoerus grypus]
MIQLLGLPDSGLRRPRTHRQLSPRRCRLGVSRDRTPVGGEIEAESHFAVPLPRLGAAAPPGTRAGSSQGRPRQDVPTQGLALGKAVGRARGRAPRALVPLRPILRYSLCRPKSPSALSREMFFRAAWSLVLKKAGPGMRWMHSPGSAVYRLQFHETFAEMNRRSNEWKTVMGCVFFFFGFTALLIWWQRVYVFPKKPITLTDEWKAQQLQRILDMKGNPVQGLASRWDYEKKEWKK